MVERFLCFAKPPQQQTADPEAGHDRRRERLPRLRTHKCERKRSNLRQGHEAQDQPQEPANGPQIHGETLPVESRERRDQFTGSSVMTTDL